MAKKSKFEAWYKKAQIWCLNQRIAELEKAIKYWPNSVLLNARIGELEEKKKELEDLKND